MALATFSGGYYQSKKQVPDGEFNRAAGFSLRKPKLAEIF